MITVEEHRSRVLASAGALPPVRVPLAAARGLVLAENVLNRWPIPLFDNSAMDGYAVRLFDATEGSRLRVVTDLPAGTELDPPLGPGEAARIMTGAPVPGDADAVVPLEQTDLGTAVGPTPPEWITVLQQAAPGAHIRRAGEESEAGSVAVPSGTVLGPLQLSALASAGAATVLVHPRPRVTVISTGSELIPPEATPRRGQIPESNSVYLAAALQDAGAELASVLTVHDDVETLRRALDSVDSDVVILSGGASVGAFDVVKALLNGMGQIRFGPVAMQPGKPQGFGTLDDGTLVFCLPGTPVGVTVSFELFVRPALRALAGHRELDRPRLVRPAAIGWHSPRHKTQVLPAVLDGDQVLPSLRRRDASSHPRIAPAAVDALVVIPDGVEEIRAGDPVSVLAVGPGRP
ncbi:molybdopterin molybdotransferase MoeA [Arthrobacter sp. RAF14]|uniref:molybdopterin molybdotransferase MoeA n=1 Tax=Arthrobacter sp. RAF14 TaxID=3233051 RepID=UPI003F8E3533